LTSGDGAAAKECHQTFMRDRSRLLMRCALGPVIVMLGELHAAIVEPGVIAEVRRTAEWACDQSFMRYP
jgi:hypothetical protein